MNHQKKSTCWLLHSNSSTPPTFPTFTTKDTRRAPFRTQPPAFLANPRPLPREPSPCMGKRLPAAAFAAAVRSYARSLRSPPAASKAAKPPPAPLDKSKNAAAGTSSGGIAPAYGALEEDERVPLADVVSDCTRRWFQDALKEARAGDAAMQVLVGQMYRSGYGVPKNEHKAKIWMEKASRYRSTVWKVCSKRPGYNASDSDSDDTNATTK